MADITYTRAYKHIDWIDNDDVVQADGERGFNKEFHNLETEFDRIATVITIIDATVSKLQVGDGDVTTPKIADAAVTTAKINNNAVTADKLAPNSVGENQIQNAAVGNLKLKANAVGRINIQEGAINVTKISFQQLSSGSASLTPGATVTQLVQANATNTKATVFLPMLTVASTTGVGIADVDGVIVYRQAVNSTNVDVFIRLTNRGAATAGVIWVVNTFAS